MERDEDWNQMLGPEELLLSMVNYDKETDKDSCVVIHAHEEETAFEMASSEANLWER